MSIVNTIKSILGIYETQVSMKIEQINRLMRDGTSYLTINGNRVTKAQYASWVHLSNRVHSSVMEAMNSKSTPAIVRVLEQEERELSDFVHQLRVA